MHETYTEYISREKVRKMGYTETGTRKVKSINVITHKFLLTLEITLKIFKTFCTKTVQSFCIKVLKGPSYQNYFTVCKYFPY